MGPGPDVLMLDGAAVDRLLDPATCVAAVEAEFRSRGQGNAGPTGVLGVPVEGGGFHVKAAASPDFRYFAAKVNANFPGNADRGGLPTIQGFVTLFDGRCGLPLAILDSPRITALRTAAASAVAAKWLAKPAAARLGVVGCGIQAWAHFEALRVVRPVHAVKCYDVRRDRAEALAKRVRAAGLDGRVADSVSEATLDCDLVLTLTPSPEPILSRADVQPGVFIAAVGADHEYKVEIAPALMGEATVVVDSLAQCRAMGDLRAAISAGTMCAEDVHAELGEVVAGRKPGRSRPDEIIVFDSTGVAFEDVAAAAAVYERARSG